MDVCEKWKLIDFGNEIATVIVKLKNLLKQCWIQFLPYKFLFSVKLTTFVFFNRVGVQVALYFQEASWQNDNWKLFNDFII